MLPQAPGHTHRCCAVMRLRTHRHELRRVMVVVLVPGQEAPTQQKPVVPGSLGVADAQLRAATARHAHTSSWAVVLLLVALFGTPRTHHIVGFGAAAGRYVWQATMHTAWAAQCSPPLQPARPPPPPRRTPGAPQEVLRARAAPADATCQHADQGEVTRVLPFPPSISAAVCVRSWGVLFGGDC